MKSASPPVYDNNSHNICFMNDGFPKARNKKLHCRDDLRDDKTEVNCKSNPTMHWIPISKTGFYMVLVLDAGLITLRLMRLDFFKLLLNKPH